MTHVLSTFASFDQAEAHRKRLDHPERYEVVAVALPASFGQLTHADEGAIYFVNPVGGVA